MKLNGIRWGYQNKTNNFWRNFIYACISAAVVAVTLAIVQFVAVVLAIGWLIH